MANWEFRRRISASGHDRDRLSVSGRCRPETQADLAGRAERPAGQLTVRDQVRLEEAVAGAGLPAEAGLVAADVDLQRLGRLGGQRDPQGPRRAPGGASAPGIASPKSIQPG